MVLELLLGMHELSEPDWNASKVQELVDQVAKRHDFFSKKTILTDPLRYFLMDRRVGPTDDQLFQHIAQRGKAATLRRLLERFSAYTSVIEPSRLTPLEIYKTAE